MHHDATRRSLLLAASAGTTAAALSGPALAATTTDSYDVPLLSSMGTVGVIPGETARLSLVMYAENPAGWMLCDGFLSLSTITGERVATSKFSIRSGHGAHLDWSPTGKHARHQVYPVVTVTTDMTTGDYSQVVMGATLEVFDRVTLVNRSTVVGAVRYGGSSTTPAARR